MAKQLIDENSKFNIYSSFSLSSDDVATMSLLYAPLLGSDAFLLYMGFNSMLERNNLKSEELLHKDIFDMYSLKPSEFIKARNKLEAIGLLVTYKNDEGNYIYLLLSPFTAKSFIKDASLGLYLSAKVRPEVFELIYKHFVIERINKDGYQNISKTFVEVFGSEVDNSQAFEKFEYIIGRNQDDNLIVENHKFDFDKFISDINVDLLEYGLTEQFKKEIVKLSYSYNFNETDMESLFNDSINKNGYYDYSILKKKANVLYQFKRNRRAPKLITKEIDDKETRDLVEYLEKVSPAVLLETISPNFPVNYLDNINKVYQDIDLPRGVLNCMIIKITRDKGGEVPSAAYFKKVAESWIKDGVLSTIDAINYVTSPKAPKESTYKPSMKDDNGGFEEL